MKKLPSGLRRLTLCFLLIPFAILLTACSEDPVEIAETQLILNITEANQNEFVRQMVSEYLILSERLLTGYQTYKQADDAHGFIYYRNKEWTPDYMAAKERYQSVLHQQKAYIYRNQLGGLFDQFMNLQKLALHLKHSLLDKDWELERQAMQRLKQDKTAVAGFLKLR